MHATPVTDVPGRPTASCGQDFERAGYRYFLSLQSADQTTLSEDSADRRMLAQLKKEIPATVSRLLTALGTNDLSQLTGPRVLSAMLPLPFISNILVRVNNTLAEGEHCTAEEMIIWLELFAAMMLFRTSPTHLFDPVFSRLAPAQVRDAVHLRVLSHCLR